MKQVVRTERPPRRPPQGCRRVEMGPSFDGGRENWEAAKGWPWGRPVPSRAHPPESPLSPRPLSLTQAKPLGKGGLKLVENSSVGGRGSVHSGATRFKYPS